jgi:hypothetical protein
MRFERASRRKVDILIVAVLVGILEQNCWCWN